MMVEEKSRLLDLFEQADRWCREAEARDASGQPVRFDDERAVAWDITGGMCHLFGWQRACVLFVQLRRHALGTKTSTKWPMPDPGIDAMRALQDLNDQGDTTFDTIRGHLEAMPVWSTGSHVDRAAATS